MLTGKEQPQMKVSAGMVIAATIVTLWRTPAIGQALAPAAGLIVVDANGKHVGSVVDFGGSVDRVDQSPRIAMVTESGVVVRAVGLEGFTAASAGGGDPIGLLYESTDCSGPPLFSVQGPRALYPTSAIGPPGKTLYVPDLREFPRDITGGSSRSDLLDAGGGKCTQFQQTIPYCVPARSIVDLAVQFTPPFRVVARSECPGDLDGNQQVTIDEVITAVNSALTGCPASQQ
jgi:hypothetical protein